MKKNKERNQNGELPSDTPGEDLVKQGKKGDKYISRNTEHRTTNSTAKDPVLGKRNEVR
jgi:hypothetical protein